MDVRTAPPAPDHAAIEGINEYLNTLRRRKWIVFAVTAMVLGAALFLSFRQTPVYSASSQVVVRATSNDAVGYFSMNLETERGVAQSDPVAEVVAASYPGEASPGELRAGLQVRVEPSTEILEFVYASPNPSEAAALANAFADAYLEARRTEALAQFELQTDDLKNRIAELNVDKKDLTRRLAGLKDPAKAAALQTQLATVTARIAIVQEDMASLGTTDSLQESGGRIVKRAVVPTDPSSPNHTQNAVVALLAGLALGCGVAFARDRSDSRLHGSADLEAKLGAPVLATIPRIDGWKKRERTELITQSEPKNPASEAYRALRTNLQFLSRRDGVRLVAVTSPFMGEGKTTTVANLAVVLSQAGKRVIAVSCDLRRPRLHRFFGCSNDRGVTDVLIGHAAIHEVAQRAPGMEHVRVIASGPVPPNPAELLASEQMEMLIGNLRGVADYVLLDLPPLLAVADGLILGPKSDGVIVVVDASATARAAAESVRLQLEQVGGKVIGGVFNNFDPNEARTYSSDYRSRYSYAYGGYYRPESDQDDISHLDIPTDMPARPLSGGDDAALSGAQGIWLDEESER